VKAAGIPKTDERGRAVDVHAMRMTLATMLNKAGVAPRTAQEIMRHSDIRLTMATYTDAKLLNVSGALDSLPTLTSDENIDDKSESIRATGTDGNSARKFPPMFPQKVVDQGETVSFPVILAGNFAATQRNNAERENRTKPTKKASSEGDSDKASKVGMTGFEPATSASRTQRSTKLSYIPYCDGILAVGQRWSTTSGEIALARFSKVRPLVLRPARHLQEAATLGAGPKIHGCRFEASGGPRASLFDLRTRHIDSKP